MNKFELLKLINKARIKNNQLETLIKSINFELEKFCKDFTPEFQYIPGDNWCICCLENSSSIPFKYFFKLLSEKKSLSLEDVENSDNWCL